GCAIDTDKDSIADYIDACRTNTAAELKFGIDPYGCAIDTDKDSIADYIDACRTNTAAELKFGIDLYGCAIDTDKDSIADYIDACRTNTTAELKFGIDPYGCAIDTDKDGIADYTDACLGTAIGLQVNEKGCVVVQAVTFASDQSFAVGKAVLSNSAKQSLTKFVQGLHISLLKNIKIIAHTDSQGGDVMNMRLSQQRARAVQTQLIILGIPKRLIHAVGKGETQPIASNTTKAGRARNRRVDVQIESLAKK
ncbi:MAG: OmpA family protein, partial [Mariprofundales bacterium]